MCVPSEILCRRVKRSRKARADGIRPPVPTRIAGILRGLLRDGCPVTPGFKVADVDPRREELENCFLISDKARCIAGSVLELIAANLWK